jgi:hypothetical protein
MIDSRAGNGKHRGAQRIIVRVDHWRPPKQFAEWIKAFSVRGLSLSIGVERKTIYEWLRGIKAPRPENAHAMIKLSRHDPKRAGLLSFEDIYGDPGDP